ncbi:MAG: aminotransferase class IV [Candidatus Omnitrophota bacterium]|nr:aminotransferase class IV [Candidatus Omnitrophota bacterium]
MVFLNGKFVASDEARIAVDEPGFLYGWGIFETMRACRQKIVYLDAHLKRLRKGAALISLQCPYQAARLKKIIRQVVETNGLADCQVRVSLWKAKTNSGILITAGKYRPYTGQKYKSGFSACVSGYCQNAGAMLARLKTMNHLFYRLASLEAGKKHCDEAIILNHQGCIAEASRSNIFFVKNNRLFTPALECGCLDGITRGAILDLAGKQQIEVCQGNFKLQDLYDAEEAFLTNSLMGVMPLAFVEGHRIGKGSGRFALTRQLGEKYNYLLKHGAAGS